MTSPLRVQVGQFAFKPITPELDRAFTNFYAAVQAASLPDAAAFDQVAEAHLASVTAYTDHDDYFNNFTPLWSVHLQTRQFESAASVWPWALRPALRIESTGSKKIHKGTAYYFWGMTELLADRLDNGYLLMHRSFEEDIRTHGSVAPSTPGYALLTLDHQRPDQAFRPWVQQQAAAIERQLVAYRTTHSRSLTLAELRAKFLAIPSYRETVQLYCYAMARATRYAQLPPQLWEGPFPAQVAFESVFDLCLVVDSVIHEKNRPAWKFIDHATRLAQALTPAISRNQFGEINGLFDTNFAGTLASALNGSLTLRDGTLVSGLGASIAVAYGCRNRGAHAVATVPLTAAEYGAVIQHLNATFFLAIEALY